MSEQPKNPDTPQGLTFALTAYIMWGVLPLYLKALSHIPAIEVVAHRILWSIPIAGLVMSDKKFTHGKKLALTVGIKAAVNEWLVFIDADCVPVSNKWLTRMQENFGKDTDIVLGYGGYEQRKGFLNAYIRYDTLYIAMQYLGRAILRKPYMGVGRNLAYRKSLFFNRLL